MQWKVEYDKGNDIVWVEAPGAMDRADIERMSADALSEAFKRRTPRILVDHRNMSPVFSASEIHSLPAKLGDLGLSPEINVAILYSKESTHRRDFEFFATVAVNRGFEVQLFEASKDATIWLRGR